jgi:hypothetical protein
MHPKVKKTPKKEPQKKSPLLREAGCSNLMKKYLRNLLGRFCFSENEPAPSGAGFQIISHRKNESCRSFGRFIVVYCTTTTVPKIKEDQFREIFMPEKLPFFQRVAGSELWHFSSGKE